MTQTTTVLDGEVFMQVMSAHDWLGATSENGAEAALERPSELDRLVESVASTETGDTLDALRRSKAIQEEWELQLIQKHAKATGWPDVFTYFFKIWKSEKSEAHYLDYGYLMTPYLQPVDLKKTAINAIELILKASHDNKFKQTPVPDTVLAACIVFLYGHASEATDLHAAQVERFVEKESKAQHLRGALRDRFHALCRKFFNQAFDMEHGWFREEAAPGGREWLDAEYIDFLKSLHRPSKRGDAWVEIVDLENAINQATPLAWFTTRNHGPWYVPALTDILHCAFNETKKVPAIRNRSVDDLRNILTGDVHVGPEGRAEIVTRKKKTVATIEYPCFTPELAAELKARINSVHAPEAIIWLMQKTQNQINIGGDPKIVVEGGWQAMAGQMGISGRDSAVRLKSSVEALVMVKPTGSCLRDSGSVTLITVWDDIPAKRNRRAYLRLELHDGFYKAQTGDKFLIPLPSRRAPRFGRPNEWGEHRMMELDTMQYFQERAAELAANGCVDFDDLHERLCREYNRKTDYVRNLFAAWATGSATDPPFLDEVRSGAYTLAQGREAELDVILRQHQIREAARRGGLKSQRNKEKRIGCRV